MRSSFVVVLSLLLCAASVGAQGPATPSTDSSTSQPSPTSRPAASYVLIEVKGVIGGDFTPEDMKALVEAASKLKPDLVVLEIDTPGGEIGSAEKIIEIIIKQRDIRFVAFVRDALSAGAAITMACKEVYVAPTAKIGGAVSYRSDGRGGVVRLPSDVAEKMQSIWRAVCRTAAEHGGYSSLLAEAMVDPSFALTLRTEDGKPVFERNGKGRVIKARDRILTLTAGEAVEVGLAKARVHDLDGLARELGLEGWQPLEVELAEAEADEDAQEALDEFTRTLVEIGDRQQKVILESLTRDLQVLGSRQAELNRQISLSREGRRSGRLDTSALIAQRTTLTQVMGRLRSMVDEVKTADPFIPYVCWAEGGLEEAGLLPPEITIVQIVERNQCLARVGSEMVLLVGPDLAGQADGAAVSYSGLVVVTGTVQIPLTTGATRSVRVVRPARFSKDDVIASYTRQRKEAAPTVSDKPEAEARRLLNMALMYNANGKPDLAIAKLQKLVAEYAGTPSAKRAAKELEKLQADQE